MPVVDQLDRALPADAPWRLVRPLGGGTLKALLVVDRHGAERVVKAHPGSPIAWGRAAVERMAVLRAAGVPVPPTTAHPVDGGLLFVQEFRSGVAGRPLTVALAGRLLEVNARQAGHGGQSPAGWRSLMRRSLTTGLRGFCEHGALESFSDASRELLARVRAAGAAAEFTALPAGDLVHFDLHLDNILSRGDELTGIVDWDNVRTGDRLLDVTELGFMGGRDATAPVSELLWSAVDALGDENSRSVMLHHVALRFADWQIRHHPPAEAGAMIDYGLSCLEERLTGMPGR